MQNLLFTLIIAICLNPRARAESFAYPPSAREAIEWCDIWISHANETNLPRVLLIGDSITRAYFPDVERILSNKAYVARLASSAFVSDPGLLKQIQLVLSQYHFAVIHFNNGMHGWQHSEMEYAAAFPKFLNAIHKYAPDATLIWANTTPIKVSPASPDGQTRATDERIVARNSIARKFVKAAGIMVDDLNTPMLGHPEYHVDNVHFNDRAIAIQAAQVAERIEQVLH